MEDLLKNVSREEGMEENNMSNNDDEFKYVF